MLARFDWNTYAILMRRPVHPLVLLLAVLAVILFGILAATTRHASQEITLSDGSKLRMTAWTEGKHLRVSHGSFWQQILFKIVKTNLPPRLVGSEAVFDSSQTNGSLGLVFTRFAKDGTLQDALNGSAQLTVMDADGKVIPGVKRAVNFDTADVGGSLKVVKEEILWEFPLLPQKEMRCRLFETNRQSNAAITNEFLLRNPLR